MPYLLINLTKSPFPAAQYHLLNHRSFSCPKIEFSVFNKKKLIKTLIIKMKNDTLSKCPLMIVDESVVTRSLHDDPANFVSVHALLLKSHILSVRSCEPVTIFCESPTNLAAITLPEWPVKVC